MLKAHLENGGNRGFSLIVVSILLTLAVFVFVAVLPGREAGDTNQKTINNIGKLERVEEAMRSFMALNGRRPCPADGQYPLNTAGFGIETDTLGDGNCAGAPLGPDALTNNIVGGTIPTRSLGLPDDYAFDDYGRHFTYVIDKRATQNASCLTLEGTGKGGIKIESATGAIPEIDDIMYAYISHGVSGYGAWPAQGGVNRINSGSTNTDMQTNAGGSDFGAPNFTNVEIKKPRTAPSGGDTGFDDLVWYRPDIKNTCCLGAKCGGGGGGGVNQTLELALVLDGNGADALASQTVMNELISKMFNGHSTLPNVTVNFIPFTAFVNLGSSLQALTARSAWIRTDPYMVTDVVCCTSNNGTVGGQWPGSYWTGFTYASDNNDTTLALQLYNFWKNGPVDASTIGTYNHLYSLANTVEEEGLWDVTITLPGGTWPAGSILGQVRTGVTQQVAFLNGSYAFGFEATYLEQWMSAVGTMPGYVENRNNDAPVDGYNDVTDDPPDGVCAGNTPSSNCFRIPGFMKPVTYNDGSFKEVNDYSTYTDISDWWDNDPFVPPLQFGMTSASAIILVDQTIWVPIGLGSNPVWGWSGSAPSWVSWNRSWSQARPNVGLLWGWMTLSPKWKGMWDPGLPNLPQPATAGHNKAIVLVTGASGYFLSPTIVGANAVGSYTDDNAELLQLCQAVGNNKITLYVVGIGSDPNMDPVLLQNCATNAGNATHFYNATSTAALQNAADAIANDLQLFIPPR